MNRFSKAAAATGVGVALLLGGAGTLALWNDSVSAAGGDIQTGVMTISQTDGGWVDGDPTLWVPGDSHVYATDIEINASGDNMKAILDVDTDGISGSTELVNALEYDLQVTDIAGEGLDITPEADGNYSVLPSTANGGHANAKVTLTVTLPESVSGTVAQNETANLQDLNLTLTQTR